MALPFGFVVSVVFLIGKWVADGEILAYRSLGGDVLALLWVVMLFGTLISVISTYSSLEWSPVNRSKFDQLKKEILWTQTNLLLEERGEIGFAFTPMSNPKPQKNLMLLPEKESVEQAFPSLMPRMTCGRTFALFYPVVQTKKCSW